MSVALALYRAATGLAEPFARGVLDGRVKRGKEDPARLNERLGRPTALRPDGALVWMHGASVGEALSLLPLVDAFRRERPETTVLVTSGTRTSAEILAKRLPAGALHQYLPVDTPGAAARFMTHWRPALGVFVESELWPNLLRAARRQGAKLALVSARIGDESNRGWSRAPGSARELFATFDLILPQDDAQAARLTALGARDDGRLNLKFAGEPLPVDAATFDEAKRELGSRPLLLAASTHSGEDEIVIAAFASLAASKSKPLLVIAPRHIERGTAIAELAHARNLVVAQRSTGAVIDDSQVYVADTLGELGVWFRLARTALIAGSLVPDIGGHNPLEALRLGCPAASGPHVADWRGVYDALIAANDVAIVRTAQELSDYFAKALTKKDSATAKAAMDLIVQRGDVAPAFAQLKALLP